MVQRHIIVLPSDDGGIQIHPMKAYLRDHPDILPGWDPDNNNSHQLRVALKAKGWNRQDTPTEIRLLSPNISLSKVIEVLGETDDGDTGSPEESESAFSLEFQLRDFLATNLETIKVAGKLLKIYVDPTGVDGIEFATPVGRIDILATDQDGNFFVFELKRANSPDRALGQLARYMGWVKKTIGRDRNVAGVIVAKTISQNLRYAASVVPNVSLFEYKIEFQLNSAHEIAP